MKGLIAALVVLLAVGVLFFGYFDSAEDMQSAEMTDVEFAEIEVAVKAVGDQLMTALNDLDIGASVALYDPSTMHGNDGTVYYATHREWVIHLDELYASLEEVNVEWTNTRVDVLAPDAAVFVGQNDGTVKRASGAVSRMQGFFTLILRNIDGVWKIRHQASVGRWTTVEEG